MAAATDERLIYEILSAVGEIPEGCVATYGQIARLIGRPKNARLVGRVLSQAERYGDYPCHRVVDHSGRLVPSWDAQAALLARRAARGPAAAPVAVRIKKKPPCRTARRFLCVRFDYLSSTEAPTSSSFFLSSSASSLETCSLMAQGTPSTFALASARPRLVISRTALMTLIF